jgi:folate-binding protein YgfZ
MQTNSTISVSGSDAFEFLQGQLSNDLRRLKTDKTLFSAWCNPKGRVICLMVVSKTPLGYAFTIPTELANEIAKRLTMFRFRSKVEFEIQPDTVIVDMAEQIESGVPWIGLEQSEKYTPHMLNLDLLDGISLDKGCYTGQEIVARTHYKGATKRRTVRLRSDEPVSVGDKVSADSKEIGDVLTVAGNDLLAVIPVDRAQSGISVRDIRLHPVP